MNSGMTQGEKITYLKNPDQAKNVLGVMEQRIADPNFASKKKFYAAKVKQLKRICKLQTSAGYKKFLDGQAAYEKLIQQLTEED